MSDDLIRQSDAIKAIEERSFAVRDSYTVKAILRNVPSADRPSAVDLSSVYSTAYKSGYEKGKADRPQGMWELVPCADISEYFEGVKHGFRFRCSNCKYERKRNKHDMNYCPNCGADMKGADDE